MPKSIRKASVLALILLAALPVSGWCYGPYPRPHADTLPLPYASYSARAGLYVRRHADEDSYYLTVLLRNLPAERLRVDIVRGALVLQALRIRQSAAGDRYGGYHSRGYQRYRRRIPLPFDADVQKMSIQREEGTVKVTIPRRKR